MGRPRFCLSLVGRDAEVRQLRAALAAARGGAGRAVAVVGPAGSGKSRLVRDVLAEDARGARVLTGRCVDREERASLRPLVEVLLAVTRAGPWPADAGLAPFVPVLEHLLAQPTVSALGSPGENAAVLVGEGLLRLLRGLAEHPAGPAGRPAPDDPPAPAGYTVLVVEDVQWADTETLTVLDYLSDHLADQPVLVVLTQRSEVTGPGAGLLDAMRQRRALDVLELGELGPAEVHAIAADCLGGQPPPPGCDRLLARAQGLPFLIEEILVAAYEDGLLRETADGWALTDADASVLPAGYTRAVERRLAALGPSVSTLVRAAALFGQLSDWPLVVAAAGADQDAGLRALRAAANAGLIVFRHDPPGVAFRHDLVRESVLATCPPGEATRLARAALAALQAARPRPAGRWLETAVALSLRAGEQAGAARMTVQLGRDALADGGTASAREAGLRAIAWTDDSDVRVEAAGLLFDVAQRVGDVGLAETAAAGLAGAEVEAGIRGGGRTAVLAHLGVAAAAVAATDWRAATSRLAAAALLLAPAALDMPDDAATDDAALDQPAVVRSAHEASRYHALRAELAAARGDEDGARRHAAEAVRLADAGGSPVAVCQALRMLGRLTRRSDLDGSVAAFTEALRIARAHGLVDDELRCLSELGIVDMLRRGDVDGLLAARERAAALGALATAALVDLQIAGAAALCFDPATALEAGRRCLDVARHYPLPSVVPMALVQVATAHVVAGRARDGEAALREAFGLAPDEPDVAASGWGHARLLGALLRDDRAAALDAADRAVAASRLAGRTIPGLFWAPWALLHLAPGRAREGGRVASRRRADEARVAAVVGAADASGIPANLALRRLPQAVLAAARGDVGTADELVAEADDAMRALGRFEGWYQLCRWLTAEAALAGGWGDPASWLRGALGFFEDGGHTPVAAACRGLLSQAGAAVPRGGRRLAALPSALRAAGVTSREAEVLRLVAGGLSNRQVAAVLVLSPRTVEKHVERLLAKTGAASRTGLVAWANTHHVVG